MHVLIGAVSASTTTPGGVAHLPIYPIVEQDRIDHFLLKHELLEVSNCIAL